MANDPINLYDYEARAKLVLPHNNWEFIEAGSMDEFTTRRNRSAFEDLKLRPRFLRDVQERKISTTVLGQEISMPVMVAPAGSHMLAHPDGEVATAQGAGRSDTLMMLSTSSNYSMEEVSDAASGPLWFQLYHRGYNFTEMLVHRAEEAGFKAIVLTIDTPVASPKERDLRNRYKREHDLGNFRGMDADRSVISGTDETEGWDVSYAPPITWRELEWLRGLTSLPLVLKGVRTSEDAYEAVEHGVDGLLVSTHGGRQLDMTMGAIEMVPGGSRSRQGPRRSVRRFRRPPRQRRHQGPGSRARRPSPLAARCSGAWPSTEPTASTASLNCSARKLTAPWPSPASPTSMPSSRASSRFLPGGEPSAAPPLRKY